MPYYSRENWDSLSVLADLTIVERNVIARSHLIGYIISRRRQKLVLYSYHGARGHVVAFKQDPPHS